jgi:hypothetical protein
MLDLIPFEDLGVATFNTTTALIQYILVRLGNFKAVNAAAKLLPNRLHDLELLTQSELRKFESVHKGVSTPECRDVPA